MEKRCLFLGLMYLISPTEEAALPEVAEEEKPALRDFTPEQLRFFDGTVDEKEAADPEAVPKPIYAPPPRADTYLSLASRRVAAPGERERESARERAYRRV